MVWSFRADVPVGVAEAIIVSVDGAAERFKELFNDVVSLGAAVLEQALNGFADIVDLNPILGND